MTENPANIMKLHGGCQEMFLAPRFEVLKRASPGREMPYSRERFRLLNIPPDFHLI